MRKNIQEDFWSSWVQNRVKFRSLELETIWWDFAKCVASYLAFRMFCSLCSPAEILPASVFPQVICYVGIANACSKSCIFNRVRFSNGPSKPSGFLLGKSWGCTLGQASWYSLGWTQKDPNPSHGYWRLQKPLCCSNWELFYRVDS